MVLKATLLSQVMINKLTSVIFMHGIICCYNAKLIIEMLVSYVYTNVIYLETYYFIRKVSCIYAMCLIDWSSNTWAGSWQKVKVEALKKGGSKYKLVKS